MTLTHFWGIRAQIAPRELHTCKDNTESKYKNTGTFWIRGNKSPLERKKAALPHALVAAHVPWMELVLQAGHLKLICSISKGRWCQGFCVRSDRSQVSQQSFQPSNSTFSVFKCTCNSTVPAYSQFFSSNTKRIGYEKEQGWKDNQENGVPGHMHWLFAVFLPSTRQIQE